MSLGRLLLIIILLHPAVSTEEIHPTTRGNSLVRVEKIGKGIGTNNIRTTQVLNECLLCSRLGTALLPDAILNSHDPDKSCSLMQKKAKKLESDSSDCKSYQDFAEPRCCDQSSFLSTYECTANVRSLILDDSAIPIVPIDGKDGTKRVLDVDTVLTFVTVKNLDVKTSILEIIVGVDLTWNDPRLKWDINDTHCVTSINVRADPSAEETEIWVPSLDLVNRVTSIQDFPATPAHVRHDGTVFWHRIGPLSAFCSFNGLRSMPFDNLSCALVFGDNGGSNSVEYKLQKTENNQPNGLKFWPDSLNFTEFLLIKERSETGYFDEFNLNTFTVKLVFERAARHYFMFTIFPTIMFTIVSFGQFALSIRGGERLSFSITVVLVQVTQSIVTAGFLPVCREMLWINLFNFVSLIFTLFGILETVLVLWIFTWAETKKNTEGKKNDDNESESLLHHAHPEADTGNPDAIQQNDSEEILPATLEPSPAASTRQTGLNLPEVDKQAIDSWKEYKFFRVITTKSDGKEEFIKKLDLICIIIFPFSYVLFNIIMFAGNSNW